MLVCVKDNIQKTKGAQPVTPRDYGRTLNLLILTCGFAWNAI